MSADNTTEGEHVNNDVMNGFGSAHQVKPFVQNTVVCEEGVLSEGSYVSRQWEETELGLEIAESSVMHCDPLHVCRCAEHWMVSDVSENDS